MTTFRVSVEGHAIIQADSAEDVDMDEVLDQCIIEIEETEEEESE